VEGFIGGVGEKWLICIQLVVSILILFLISERTISMLPENEGKIVIQILGLFQRPDFVIKGDRNALNF
jgi:hypothetical protein